MKFKKTNLYVYPYFHDFVFIHYIHTREYDKKPIPAQLWFTHGPKFQVPIMTWMPTWQHFPEARLGTCVASWVEQKARPNSQPKSHKYFCR